MHQAVLMQADIHEGAEIHNVAHRTGEPVAHLQVADIKDVAAQERAVELLAVVAQGLADGVLDVMQSVGVDAQGRGLLGGELGVLLAQGADAAGGHEAARCLVALGVDSGLVKGLVPVLDTQEAGALLEGLGAEALDLEQLAAVGEAAVLVAVVHDLAGDGGVEAGDVGQQLAGGGVEVGACAVDTLHDGFVQPLGQRFLGQIVLILADADGFGVDFDELGQGVEQAARDGDGAALLDGHVRELLARSLLRGPDGGAGLGDDGVAHVEPIFADELRDELLALARGGAVADGDDLHAVLADEREELLLGGREVDVLAAEGKDLVHGEHAAGLVDDGELAAVIEAGVEAEDHAPGERRLQQELFEVCGEDLNGAPLRALGELGADLALDGGEEQPVTAVLRREAELRLSDGLPVLEQRQQSLALEQRVVKAQGDADDLFLLGAVDGHDAVVCEGAQAFRVVIVIAVDLFLVLRVLFLFGDDGARLEDAVLEVPALLGIVAHGLGDDIARALERCRGVGDLLGDIFLRLCLHVSALGQSEQPVRQGLEPDLDGRGGAGLFLLHIGTVDILYLGELRAAQDALADLVGELALLGDETQDVLLALGEAVFIVVLLLDGEDLLLIQAACLLLAVASDKGDGIPLFQHFQGAAHLLFADLQLLGERGEDLFVHVFLGLSSLICGSAFSADLDIVAQGRENSQRVFPNTHGGKSGTFG